MAVKNERTEVCDRPWAVGDVFFYQEGDEEPDIIQIVAYLHEDNTIVPTEVVYKVLNEDDPLFWSETVERAKQWISELVVVKAVTGGQQ